MILFCLLQVTGKLWFYVISKRIMIADMYIDSFYV